MRTANNIGFSESSNIEFNKMKNILLLIVLTFFSAAFTNCKNGKPNQKAKDAVKESVVSDEYSIHRPIDSTILQADAISILGKHFKVIYKTNDSLLIIRDNDTIHNSLWHNNGFEFGDFDQDGYKDLLINYLTNIGGVYDILLFNPKDFTFTLIDKMTDYPSSEHLTQNYYYSYHRAGCADLNWISDLFEIQDYKTILLGEIYGQGCNSDPKKVEVFKIGNNDSHSKHLFLTLPIDTLNKYSDFKWGFIKDYWTKNYNKFVN
jgi:hypothetical protein